MTRKTAITSVPSAQACAFWQGPRHPYCPGAERRQKCTPAHSRRMRGIEEPPVLDAQKLRRPVRLALVRIENVNHRDAAHRERVGQQPAMTLPPQPLGAHVRSRGLLWEVQRLIEGRCQLRRFEV